MNDSSNNAKQGEGGLPDRDPPSFMMSADGATRRSAEGRKMKSTLASRLKGAREAAGLSPAELATKAGVSRSFVSRIEAGQREDMSLRTAADLCRTLKIGLDDLAGLKSAAPRSRTAKLRKLLETALATLEAD